MTFWFFFLKKEENMPCIKNILQFYMKLIPVHDASFSVDSVTSQV